MSPQGIWQNILLEDILSQTWMSPGRQVAAPKAWATFAECSTFEVSSTVSWAVIGFIPTISLGAQTSSNDDGPRSSDASASASVRALFALGGGSATTSGLSISTTYGGWASSSRAAESESALCGACSGEITSNTALLCFLAWAPYLALPFPLDFLPISSYGSMGAISETSPVRIRAGCSGGVVTVAGWATNRVVGLTLTSYDRGTIRPSKKLPTKGV